jgi:hypothetical protein
MQAVHVIPCVGHAQHEHAVVGLRGRAPSQEHRASVVGHPRAQVRVLVACEVDDRHIGDLPQDTPPPVDARAVERETGSDASGGRVSRSVQPCHPDGRSLEIVGHDEPSLWSFHDALPHAAVPGASSEDGPRVRAEGPVLDGTVVRAWARPAHGAGSTVPPATLGGRLRARPHGQRPTSRPNSGSSTGRRVGQVSGSPP